MDDPTTTPDLGKEALAKVVTTLSEAITIQMARLTLAHEREKTAKLPLEVTDSIVHELAFLCSEYCRAADVYHEWYGGGRCDGCDDDCTWDCDEDRDEERRYSMDAPDPYNPLKFIRAAMERHAELRRRKFCNTPKE
jgi:hypothetical protein